MQKSYALQFHDTPQISAGINEINEVRAIQVQQGGDPCFMTSERLLCKNLECDWRRDCRKLVAVWKR